MPSKAKRGYSKPSARRLTAPTECRIGIVTVMRDVTDLRRADQELRQNYELLRQAEEVVRQDRDRLNLIIENVGDPIVVCDSKARNRAARSPGRAAVRARGYKRRCSACKNQAKIDAYI